MVEIICSGLICVSILICFFGALSIHEFGHFYCSRVLKIKVESIVIGIGPELMQKQINDFRIHIKLFPVKAHLKTNTDIETYFALPLFHKIFLSAAGPLASLFASISIFLLLLFLNDHTASPLGAFSNIIRDYGHILGIPFMLYTFFILIKNNYANVVLVFFVINVLILAFSCLPLLEHDLGKIIFNIINHARERSIVVYILISKIMKCFIHLSVLVLSILDIFRFVF